VLYISSTASVACCAVTLCDVAADGTSAAVTKGYTTLTHRDREAEPSCVEPGRIYRIEIELMACAYRFAAGHQIRLSIAASDFLNAWPTPHPCTNTIYRGSVHPSALWLPDATWGGPERQRPDLRKIGDCRIEELEAPSYSVGEEFIGRSAFIRYNNPDLRNDATFTVSLDDPAQARIVAEASYVTNYNGKNIEARARCLTESDHDTFRHSVTIVVTVDNSEFFTKKQDVSVPRRFF
jgi:hypothetical protein